MSCIDTSRQIKETLEKQLLTANSLLKELIANHIKNDLTSNEIRWESIWNGTRYRHSIAISDEIEKIVELSKSIDRAIININSCSI